MKRIFKFATGNKIPKGSKYLGTVTQTKIQGIHGDGWIDCFFVWHYFLVEVTE